MRVLFFVIIIARTSFARDWRAFNLSLRNAPFANARFSAVMCVMKKRRRKRKNGKEKRVERRMKLGWESGLIGLFGMQYGVERERR